MPARGTEGTPCFNFHIKLIFRANFFLLLCGSSSSVTREGRQCTQLRFMQLDVKASAAASSAQKTSTGYMGHRQRLQRTEAQFPWTPLPYFVTALHFYRVYYPGSRFKPKILLSYTYYRFILCQYIHIFYRYGCVEKITLRVNIIFI